MIDIRLVRENPELVAQNAKNKGYDIDVNKLVALDNERRSLQQQVDELREKRNQNSSKMKGGKPDQATIDEGKQIKVELAEREGYLAKADTEFTELFKKVPNMAASDVPVGASEDENVVAKTVGEPTAFDFEPKNHAEIAEAKGWLDKERAAKVTGSRFAYLKGDLVRLQFAIFNLLWIS